MLEQFRLVGRHERSIRLQTHAGTDVPNIIESGFGREHLERYRQLRQRHGKHWQQRKPACGIYNCAGFVWASRRTSILDEAAWELILNEDGYRSLNQEESPTIGDLVSYRASSAGFLHVGMIVEVTVFTDLSSPTTKVLSKWNSTSGEDVHAPEDVGHLRQFDQEIRIEFWTDRPAPAKGKKRDAESFGAS